MAPPSGAEEVAWDLTDLYAGVDDPALEHDLDDVDSRADSLAKEYHGHIADLDAGSMFTLLESYESILEDAYKVAVFAHLLWASNTEEAAAGALMQKTMERVSRLNQKLIFLELEWANITDKQAKKLLADPSLSHYRHWLELTRRYRPYLLSEPEEKLLAEKAVTGREAWERFFDEVHSAARYEFDGQQMTEQMVISKLYDVDRDVRQRATESISTGLKLLSRTTTYIFNTILADKFSDDHLRGYSSWISARNLSNEVDDRMVDTLIEAVTARYDIVARYYRLKQRLLGLDELFEYDRYAPLSAADRTYRWNEARDIVLGAYGKFHPRMAEIANMFFEKKWIDASARPGKRSGAFSHGCVPSVHPYILVNYKPIPREVRTLAHELGHGVHQYLARPRGLLQSGTPLTMAETASVFGEMLVFEDMLSRETDPVMRLAMLTQTIEDSFATIFRQVAMNRFEHAIHNARREEGELTAERFSEAWLETQRAMFGDSVTLTNNYSLWWSYIPHFVSTPGYVYAYAFGNLLVLALYARYQEMGADFAPVYLDMLAAGRSDWPHEIVKPLGIDLTDPRFWDQGLQIMDGMVHDAEKLAEE
ncbi:MAG: M3 family oligoendopeptidase [Anaerolineae bacterium]|nr:M3 family oligoendopeptidase [Anaerolineae bacterium]